MQLIDVLHYHLLCPFRYQSNSTQKITWGILDLVNPDGFVVGEDIILGTDYEIDLRLDKGAFLLLLHSRSDLPPQWQEEYNKLVVQRKQDDGAIRLCDTAASIHYLLQHCIDAFHLLESGQAARIQSQPEDIQDYIHTALKKRERFPILSASSPIQEGEEIST